MAMPVVVMAMSVAAWPLLLGGWLVPESGLDIYNLHPQNSILTLKLMDSKIWFQKSCMFGTTFQSVAFDVPIYLSYLNHFCKIEKPMASTTTSSHSPSRREALKF